MLKIKNKKFILFIILTFLNLIALIFPTESVTLSLRATKPCTFDDLCKQTIRKHRAQRIMVANVETTVLVFKME